MVGIASKPARWPSYSPVGRAYLQVVACSFLRRSFCRYSGGRTVEFTIFRSTTQNLLGRIKGGTRYP